MTSSFLASSSSRQSDSTKAENGFRCSGIEGSPDHENENGVAWTCSKATRGDGDKMHTHSFAGQMHDDIAQEELSWDSGLEDLTVALNSGWSFMSRRPRRSGRLKQTASSPAGGNSSRYGIERSPSEWYCPSNSMILYHLGYQWTELAIERGRWMRGTRTADVIPMQFRICRLCTDDIEDELHVLFLCVHPDLEGMRHDFLADVWRLYPALKNRARSPLELLHLIMGYHDLLPSLGNPERPHPAGATLSQFGPESVRYRSTILCSTDSGQLPS
ncbi:hypothetical protein EDD85DRAFT_789716 [Armillaria nabsnona]|nr:hypothetical protein EDD85DRAFT_789716 [Armillaria nabsnona]